LLERFLGLPAIGGVLQSGERTTCVRLADGIEARLHAVPPAAFAVTLLHATGSDAHVERLRARAPERGLVLGGHALGGGGRGVDCSSEQAIYRALDLPHIEPELREDRGEIEAAVRDALPQVVTMHHLRGSLHNHTDFSDGADTVEHMAHAARALGHDYLGLT